MSEDPFKLKPDGEKLAEEAKANRLHILDARDLAITDVFYNEIDEKGNVCKYKRESGVPVKVADLGKIKDYFNRAINKASVMSPNEVAVMDFGDMTHIEIAAIKLAAYAAAGDLKSMQELFDRILGKAKQVSESTNLNLTIDDVLHEVQAKPDIIDIVPE